MTPLRIAFFGTGQMARQHLRACTRSRIPVSVVGVFDPDGARASEFAATAQTDAFASADALLRRARPDVVHVCTPPAAHFEGAAAALDAGAHVYVEKPFALRSADAQSLLDRAQAHGLTVCAGHQLLRDPAFETLIARAAELGTLVQVDSHFAFRPTCPPSRCGARAIADQAVDILPHPLYTLVAILERFGPPGASILLEWMRGSGGDLQAILRAGELVGRLSVSLTARPVASSLTLIGTGGSLTCDFVRSIVVGAANPGVEPLEKVLNPIAEGMQLIARTGVSVARRVRSGTAYPGLAELINAFYQSIAGRGTPPVSSAHLLRVTTVFAQLASGLQHAAGASAVTAAPVRRDAARPGIVVTGARGFLGSAIARALGGGVVGIGRASNPDDLHVREWVVADMGRGVPAGALAGARVVVHAAAATSGGRDAHQRNTLEATRHLLHAMHDAGVSRLVLVSSLSVLRPPRTPWERQDELTPRADDPQSLGWYTWGKTLQEDLVAREAATLNIRTVIVRPGALLDLRDPSVPGLMGRHLFGRWHLGIGRARLPIAACDVRVCADAIAWCATHFDEAPPVVNLFDPALTTRAAVRDALRAAGWKGRMVWVPTTALCGGIAAARTLMALLHGELPTKLSTWSILRPRRYDSRLAAALLERTAGGGVAAIESETPLATDIALPA